MNPSNLALKAAVIVHFILTVWASMSQGFLPLAYTYMNLFVLLIGLFAVVHNESVDAMFLFLVLHIFTILQDVIFLSIYQPRADDNIEKDGIPDGIKSEYRFSLGMCIINLIIKPLTGVLLYRIWQDRQGNAFDLPFTIPGMGNQNNSKYENIDQPVPSNSYVETASSPRGIDNSHTVP